MGPILSQEGHFFLLDTVDQLGNVYVAYVKTTSSFPKHAAKPMKVNLESRVSVTVNLKIGSSNQIIEKQSIST